MPFSSLFNPAGGIRYHLRALRYSKELWQPFRQAIGNYILSWQVASKTLLIVGVGGGYCMPSSIFNRFEQLVCLEPDPAARFIFSRRIAQAQLERPPRIEFIKEDCLLRNPRQLVCLAENLGNPALLFSNVLGQLCHLLQIDTEADPRLMRIRDAVAEVTEHRAFASFHDRVSGGICPTFTQPFLTDCRLSDEAMLSSLFEGHQARYRLIQPELLDHLTKGFFPETLPHAYFTWHIKPKTFHVIEAVMLSQGWRRN